MLLIVLFTNSFSFAEISTLTREDRERLIRLETTLKKFKDSVDKRFEQIDKRFEQIDRGFEQIDKRLGFATQEESRDGGVL